MRSILLSYLAFINMVSVFPQVYPETSNEVISGAEKLIDPPSSLIFFNTFEINNQGGHLQGIQYLKHKENDYYILSGSSEEYSYYSIVKSGIENKVISVNKLLDKPFKHAGGFQIFQNLMAIGVEDNDAKKMSKVFIFNLDNPEKPPEEPLAVIDRSGSIRRATAGCVGITVIEGKVLIVVGDWDTEHLDFYIADHLKLGNGDETPELAYSIEIKNINKTGWTDDNWLAYQNVNFIQDDAGHLFLAGMASDENNENVLDLFKVESDKLSSFKLVKIHTRKFSQNKQTGFRWGAGISFLVDNQIKLYSCCEHIEGKSVINIY